MIPSLDVAQKHVVPALSAHVITEALALRRFTQLLDTEHTLGSRQPKGRALYQLICRGDEWVALVLWTSPLWHFKARDQWVDWDRSPAANACS